MNDNPLDLPRFVGLTLDEAGQVARAEGLHLRVIEPGMVYTMEYLENRVNVTVGVDGRITSARRG